MTSNIGSEYLLENKNEDHVEDEIKSKVMTILKSRFKPEFLNRVDDIIMFKPLTESGIKKIIDIFLKDVARRLKDKNIIIEVTDEAETLMAREGYDPHYGARPLGRLIQNKILNKVASFIISKGVKKGDTVYVTLKDNDLVIEMKKKKIVSNVRVSKPTHK